jgi:hydrogenase maturation protease
MASTCIVGLGSPNGDDQFGWLVVERLAVEISQCGLPDVITRRAAAPVQVLDWLDGIKRLLLIDACHGYSAPGNLVRLEWPAREIEQIRGSGTHDYTVWQTLNLASQLGTLPQHCHLWCAAEQQCDPFQPLSPSLLALVPQVVDDAICLLTK